MMDYRVGPGAAADRNTHGQVQGAHQGQAGARTRRQGHQRRDGTHTRIRALVMARPPELTGAHLVFSPWARSGKIQTSVAQFDRIQRGANLSRLAHHPALGHAHQGQPGHEPRREYVPPPLPRTAQASELIHFGIIAEVLEDEHYGLKDVKERILEFIAVGALKGEVTGMCSASLSPSYVRVRARVS